MSALSLMLMHEEIDLKSVPDGGEVVAQLSTLGLYPGCLCLACRHADAYYYRGHLTNDLEQGHEMIYKFCRYRQEVGFVIVTDSFPPLQGVYHKAGRVN